MYDPGDYSDNSATRWKDTSAAKGTRAAGGSLAAAGNKMISDSRDDAARNVHAVQYRKGGKVRSTGRAIVHRGERVIPANKRKKVDRMLKRSRTRMTNRGRR